MAVGTGGRGGEAIAPNILPFKKIKIVNFGNHRYTNEENCILYMCKCDIKKIVRLRSADFFAPPPIPKPFLRPCYKNDSECSLMLIYPPGFRNIMVCDVNYRLQQGIRA